jgi:hypothetical protein
MFAYTTCGDVDDLLQEYHVSCVCITLLFHPPFWKDKMTSEVLKVVNITISGFFVDVTSTSFIDK